MKIIHAVLGKANPDRMNGVNKVAYQLAKTQQELGHDVTVWGIANSLEHNYPPRNFKTELFLQRANKLQLDSALEQAVERLHDHTVVHLHGAFIPEFYWLTKLLRRRGVEYVFTPHGAFSKVAMQKSGWRKRLYFLLWEKTLVKNAKAVQLLGDLEYNHLGSLLKSADKVLIPNGMELSEIPSIAQKKPNPVLTFGFCGRLDTYYKGLDLLLHGFSLFLKKGHQAHLELIGDGGDRTKLEQLAEALDITEHLTFHGAKFGDEKFQLMAQCDVFVHTSRSEGFPIAVLEASALGLPCLTSEGTNINRYIRQYNAGFPMEGQLDPLRICEAMETADGYYAKNELTMLGQNAKSMVQEAFDWKRICQELLGVYGG